MEQIKTIAEMQDLSRLWQKSGHQVAVVPTMGALHEGHLSLIRIARQYAQKVIVTIFVNPTQFGEGEDFDAYPRPLEEDMKLCDAENADVIFTPSASEMYPSDSSTWVEETQVGLGLCGGSRPGHFRGVTTIVSKLFLATLPDFAVFGEKDFQQLAVIRRLVRDLNFPVKIIGAPLVRENDGLALSSRNRYLSAIERVNALSLSKSLHFALNKIREDRGIKPKIVIDQMKEIIISGGGDPDYVEIVNAEDLSRVHSFEKPVNLRVLAAAVYGPARLIDNMGLELA